MIKTVITSLLSLTLTIAAYAANPAADQASNSPYTTGPSWTAGQNGGFGFGAWTFTSPAGSSFFVNSSSINAGGSSGNIDTAGVSWGMFSNNGTTAADAVRPLTGGSLSIGQGISLKIDNGFIQGGTPAPSEGFGLQTSTGSNRLEFFFNGGNSNYTLADGTGTGTHDTGIGFTGNGLSFLFTLTGTNTYSLDVTPNGAGTTTFTGTLEGVAGTGIDQLRFFDFNGGTNSDSNFYVNSLQVIPEPSTWLAAGLTLSGCLLLRRRCRTS